MDTADQFKVENSAGVYPIIIDYPCLESSVRAARSLLSPLKQSVRFVKIVDKSGLLHTLLLF